MKEEQIKEIMDRYGLEYHSTELIDLIPLMRDEIDKLRTALEFVVESFDFDEATQIARKALEDEK